ncbi:putative lipoprotein [Cupriavidus necator]|uniref:Putative lipoprotein n=1 Tax=Cupriavidus necator TaxID=106590 RepID=A0A1K0ISI1_CUPNE|nr:putative lipoprotein [Cupriavidus necator]
MPKSLKGKIQGDRRLSARGLLTAAAISASLLSACGGDGSDSATNPSTPAGPTQPTPNLTGKAIDGYLVGAKVCLDLDASGSCDAGEPSTTTDENGGFGLVADAAAIGKTLLVVVDTNTKDKSRPGFSFPAGFVLYTVVDGMTGQHVTPITTMVQAQVQSGKSQAAAEQAVASLLGGKVSLKADYIANGDSNTSAFAAQVVDKVVEFAKADRGDTDTVRAVMNAIVTKGGVTTVTQADVDAARAKPLYTADVDAQALLAEPLYTYAGTLGDFTSTPPKPVLVRQVWTRNAQGQQSSMEELGLQASGWMPSPTGASALGGIYGAYALKADGGWSPFIPAAALDGAYNVQATQGNVITGTDANTGIGIRLEFRRTVLDSKAFVNVMPSSTSSDMLAAMTGAFGAGTTGYAVIRSEDTDMLTIPASSQCGSANPIVEDGVQQCPLLGTPTNQYTSVLDVLTVPPVPFLQAGLFGYMRFGPNGQLVVYDGRDSTKILLDNSKISWSLYSRNQSVMVLNVKYEDIAAYADSASYGTPGVLDVVYSRGQTYRDVLKSGAKFVIALHNGHLRYGLLVPAGVETSTALLKQPAFDQLTEVVKQALATTW